MQPTHLLGSGQIVLSSRTTPKACTIGVCRCGHKPHMHVTGMHSTRTPATMLVPYLWGKGVPSHHHLLVTEASRKGGEGGHTEHLVLDLPKVPWENIERNHTSSGHT